MSFFLMEIYYADGASGVISHLLSQHGHWMKDKAIVLVMNVKHP